ncbi:MULTISPECIES: efflux RND transporter periplasmic adaptor subunit [Bacteroidota]|uniref:RND family efflux transporter, MFP subunit n=3 Tax=Bacteroidota TaxID=976 RepID=A0A1N7QAP4_9FLAO|nr:MULTISPECIES: efflux RND transporter periplasmic adaptor subunit [Bacteroidota]TCV15262.1 RND family efflux transporter MFP subunit [Sphingobacterium alimentarium]SHK25825.1 RND family efflux transporter, MFP subunit [Epilithonimonas mollis]SIT19963.1 RND family efflux transporter, MFP subunit [Chryseobacterium ureilyticum]
MRNKIFLIVGVLLVVGLVWFKLSSNQKKVDKEIRAEQEAVPFAIEAIAVTEEQFDDSFSYPGQLETTGMVNLVAETDGKVVKLNIQNGSKVSKGQVIAVLENPMKQPSHQIHQIEYEKAKVDYQRYAELHKQNNATGVELETARHALNMAEKQLKISQSELSRTTVIAPISGVIATKSASVGDYLSPGSPVAVIIPLNQLEVRFQVPEKEISKIKQGKPVRFTVDAYPTHHFEGVVSAIIPNANQAKTFPVLAKVNNNQHGITLMGGMTVNVDMDASEKISTLVIPRTAVRGDFNAPYVWLVGEGKKAVRRPFQKGRELEDYIEVISGLKPGDIVVTKGQSNITEGIDLTSVKITESKADIN